MLCYVATKRTQMNYSIFSSSFFFKSDKTDQIKYVRKIWERSFIGRLALDTKNLSSTLWIEFCTYCFHSLPSFGLKKCSEKVWCDSLPLGTNVFSVALAIVCEQKEWTMCLVCQFGAEFTGQKGWRGAVMVDRQRG